MESGIFTRQAPGWQAVIHDWKAGYRRHRYQILFFTLLLSIVAIPLFSALGFRTRLIEILFFVNLFAAVFPIASVRVRRIMILFVVLAAIAQTVSLLLSHLRLTELSLATLIVIALYGAYYAIRFAFQASRIDDEHIYAALSAYLLAGIFLGILYLVMQAIWPGSLLVNGSPVKEISLSKAIYFSFVTIATVGYGDIVPNTDLARSFTIVEAVAGQLYLVAMVARLVSLWAAGRHERGER